MSFEEIRLRLRKKAYQRADANYCPPERLELEPSSAFPTIPPREETPAELLEALRADASEILAGKWKAFGHLPLKVDDPPRWQFDYLVRKDFQSTESAFKLDHRAQAGGADIKIIWEPSRWNQLVRLAMAAYLLQEEKAGQKCVEWLLSWCKANKPFTGLNWTSGLETGMRLIQFTWIDALLSAANFPEKTLNELRNQVLPSHVWYTSRHRSFGSSANNHLIGELAGLIVSVARWPELTQFTDSLRDLNIEFEREVLAQFAPDGGNNEQALSYHLFSWEFCWQSLVALKNSGVIVATEVQDRLRKAGEFYGEIKPGGDPWDFGDSDNAFVTPLFASETQAPREWWEWFNGTSREKALNFWWGDFPRITPPESNDGWELFQDSGYAVFRRGSWFLRWDFSPLGYLSMAPHGHLDALHISLWYNGDPLLIDPGTGAYYADKSVRNFLADWSSHNGPHLQNEFPRRRGTFLWSEHHERPEFSLVSEVQARAVLKLPFGTLTRQIEVLEDGFKITDSFSGNSGTTFYSNWKFGPKLELRTDPITLSSSENQFRIELSGWETLAAYNPEPKFRDKLARTSEELKSVPFDSLVSPAFRSVSVAPFLKLRAQMSTASFVIFRA
jgi:hypothetical protein